VTSTLTIAAVAESALAALPAVHWTEYAKLAVSVLGFGGTIFIIILGLRQYRRGEQWKRGEFIADEVKEFEANPAVRSVYVAIDWSERHINLTGKPDAPMAEWTHVTRDFLWRALLPHEVNAQHPQWRMPQSADQPLVEGHPDGEGRRGIFTRHAALARDAFDVFFDRLGRFGHFIEAGLVEASEVQPYLSYWLTDLTTDQGDEDDARWRCAVLSYLFVYRFQGAITLLTACGYDVSPDGALFDGLRARMKHDELFVALRNAARNNAPELLAVARRASPELTT
jgi:hypothetical protein